MRKKVLILMSVLATMTVSAQEVNKSTVQSQANAAAAAKGDLKKVDTGDKLWKFSGVAGLNAAATGMINWAAGGNNNLNGVVYGRLRLLYHKNKLAWDSNLDTEYGLSYIDQTYDKLQKSNDKFNFSSKLGYEFAKNWYATGLIGFRTQYALGYNYTGNADANPIISKGLAPAYTDISIGIDWKPNDIFSVYISPLAGRFTTVKVSDDTNRAHDHQYPVADGGLEQVLKDKYSVWKYDDANQKDYTRNTRSELGFSLKGAVNYSIKDFKVSSTLGLYTPYSWDKKEVGRNGHDVAIYRDNGRRIGNFDVDWDVALSYQFLKCLQATLSTSLRYYNGVMIDKDGYSCERVQFKSVLGIGLGYNF